MTDSALGRMVSGRRAKSAKPLQQMWTAFRDLRRSSTGKDVEVGNGPVCLQSAIVERQSKQGRVAGDESSKVERDQTEKGFHSMICPF